jgi:beta-glucosidase
MTKPVYKDSNQPIEVRVKDLLSRMTLKEKVDQMTSVWVRHYIENDEISLDKIKEDIKDGIGQITRLAGTIDIEPKKVAELANEIQRFLLEETRLGIPAIIHEECLSGFMSKAATNFPQAINYGSTWNEELIQKVSETIRKQMRAVGVHQGLSPLLDVSRDARWGRVEETFGEDPYLVARLGTAYVKGLQGEDISKGVIATPKHFASYPFGEGGRNIAPAHLGPRELRDVFLFPFEVAIKEGGAWSLMNAYHEIDGVPCNASKELLTKILREEWGFKGYVVSDYFSINMLHTIHFVAENLKEAAVLSAQASVDVELPHRSCYSELLIEAVQEGKISERKIDEIVSRILYAKFKLGLFENPYVKAEDAPKYFDTPEDRELARQVARESIVLLKNEGNLLPLSKDIKSIALIGPSIDSKRNLLGDYAYTAHLAKDKESIPIVSIAEGIKAKLSPDTLVNYAKGCDIVGTSKEGFKEAIEAAKKSDVIVVAVGGKSGLSHLSPDNTCGEGNDRSTLNLPGVQEDLLKELHKLGKPIVVILVNGRPLAIEWVSENIPAVLEVWLPGEEGGNAVADVLFGDYNPGGKLPMTFPRNAGQEPIYYNHKPSGIREKKNRDVEEIFKTDYVDSSTIPVFPFGHGLSYTEFEYSNLKIEPAEIENDGTVCISCEIENTGKVPGDEVVQLYIRDLFASVERPVMELKGFKRINLKPGEKKTVKFKLPTDLLAFHNVDLDLVVEPGAFKVMVGSSSEDIRLEGDFKVTGKVRKLGGFRKFKTEVEIS